MYVFTAFEDHTNQLWWEIEKTWTDCFVAVGSALEAAGVAGVAGSVVAPDGGCVGDDAQNISAGAGPLIGLVAGTSPSVEVMATPEDGGCSTILCSAARFISPPAVAA
jgi:hypothetical protein